MANVRKRELFAAHKLRGSRGRRNNRRKMLLEHLESRVYQSGTPVGVNLEEVKDWSRSFMFVDAMKSARIFGSAANPWDQSAPVDENGWPTGDAGTCVITLGDNPLPGQSEPRIDGTYAFSATGRVNSPRTGVPVPVSNVSRSTTYPSCTSCCDDNRWIGGSTSCR